MVEVLAGALFARAALAFPGTDPSEEVLLPAVSHTARGDWTPDVVQLRTSAGFGDDYWLADDGTMADGMVRARIEGGMRAGILFRASVGDDPESLSAHGLTFDGDEVAFTRWDAGVSLPATDPIAVPGLTKRRSVEVVLFLTGSSHAAFVYDGDTLEQLAALSHRDARYRSGTVGVWQGSGAPTRLMSLSVLRSEPVRSDDDADAPFSAERLVTLATADGLPEGLVARAEGERFFVVTDAVGVERIARAGLVPLAVTGHVPFRFLDPVSEGPWAYADSEEVEGRLAAWHDEFPALTSLELLGTSHGGRPITVLRIATHPGERPAVLVDAAHHGSELLATSYALDVIDSLLKGYGTDKRMTRWVDGLDLWVVPLVNPDGNHTFVHETHWAGRKNARDLDGDGVVLPWEGVDLNRNYPFAWGSLGEAGSRTYPLHYWYRGPEAGSEPEVRAMMALADREHFVAALSLHTLGTLVLSPYTIDHVENPSPDPAWPLAEAMVAATSVQENGKHYQVKRKIYPVDGTSQDWLFHEHGTLAYIVEGTHHNPLSAETRRASVLGLRPLWQTLFDRLEGGPRISGRVVNPNGEPMSVPVEVSGLRTKEAERWTSRASDGRFDRVVPGPGTYVVRGTAPDGRSVEVSVVVGKGPAWTELRFPAPSKE